MKEELQNSCECWFLDVGQGTSNVILLGEGRAIVIDCGPKSSKETIELLNRYVHTIEALVISHNDEDHDGNVQRILNQYRKAVNAIYFLKDRSPSSKIATFALLSSPEYKKDFPEPKGLVTDCTVFSENNLNLTVLYPGFMDNLEFEDNPNLTSGVLRLKCGNRKIVYPGDAGIKSWKSLSQKYGQKPLTCDVMAIPHHGGGLAKINRPADHQELYSKYIKPQYGVISVGSSNSYKHPLPEAIVALRKQGIEVICSQMTVQCCQDLELVRRVPRSIPQPSRSSKRQDKTQGGKSRNVACFGSVAIEVSENDIKISDISAFNRAFQKFEQIPSFTPMCKI
ncbi:MAG: MBL fold metallo-hydrolase [Planctomycetes bacterium]|nr:MBL fold metallo-hydrolase [Planctomycetota bacterium]